ncbi:hypothetical protein AUC69_13700 [Methyloceanibacter superfactus]|uniref:Uncharacterized protein n=1 Tax=Methyloceanibacter superfactus TaxID=1774969 RepID=A0A1E3VTQ1_9HYPH|nr:hypothetical protein AUC69_13700 [Methyloceanibacter superfactus]
MEVARPTGKALRLLVFSEPKLRFLPPLLFAKLFEPRFINMLIRVRQIMVKRQFRELVLTFLPPLEVYDG